MYRLPGLLLTLVQGLVACCLCVGVPGLAPITHRKQALALSTTLNTQEIHTGNRFSTPCARLARSSILVLLSSTSQRRAGCQSPAAHSADNLSNFFVVCTVFRSPSNPHTSPAPDSDLPWALQQNLVFTRQESGQSSAFNLYNASYNEKINTVTTFRNNVSCWQE